jgi:hypothetical protein
MAEKRKAFTGRSAGQARTYACDWLRNFRDHGPLDIRSIRVSEEGGYFIATVTYADMAIEAAPQYFANYEPVLLKLA